MPAESVAPDGRLAARMLLSAVVLAIPAALTGLLVGLVGSLPAVVIACAVGVAGGVTLGLRRPEAPVLALLVAAVLLGSPIIPPEGRYLPSLACMVATTIATGVALYHGRSLRLPSRPVAVLVALYLAVASVATITSIDPQLSLVYVAGVATSLGVAFVAVPTLLMTPTSRLAFVAMAGGLGIGLAATSLGLWLVGPLTMFHEPLGIYMVTELRVADMLTGAIVPRASGPYLTPGYQALNLSIGLVSLLSIRPIASRSRMVIDVGIAIVVLAILLTMARGGWLVACVGALAVALIVAIRTQSRSGPMWSRASIDVPALGSFAVVGLALMLLLTNTIGADARYDLAVVRYGDAAAGTSEEDLVTGPGSAPRSPGGAVPPTSSPPNVAVRGGAESSSREVIWTASFAAIAARPITGYGPGTNAEALAPFLSGSNAVYQGLTSHNTWLRTAIEMGIGGVASLLGIIVVTALIVLRDRHTDRRLLEPSSTALLASTAALVVGQTTETMLLGGLTYASLFWAMAIGLVVARPVSDWQPSATGIRSRGQAAGAPSSDTSR